MTKLPKPTLSPSDAKEILERALWFSRKDGFVVPGSDKPGKMWRQDPTEKRFDEACVALLRGAAALACYASDPALLPLVIDALDLCVLLTDELDRSDPIAVFAETIERLLDLGAPVTAQVLALAKHESALIRCALVVGLSAAAAEFETLMRSLAEDTSPQVRKKAKEALSVLGEPPWWAGLFARDPGQILSPDEAARLSPTLARWAELNNQPYGPRSGEYNEVYAILDELPDVLARDALVRLLASEHHLYDNTRLANRLARIPDAIDAVLKIMSGGDIFQTSQFLEKYGACEEAKSERSSRRVLEMLEQGTLDRDDPTTTAWTIGKLALDLWPPSADPSDLLEHAMQHMLEGDDDDDDGDEYGDVISRIAAKSPSCFPPLRERVIEGWLSGESVWKKLASLRIAVLDDLPLEIKRQTARRALESLNTDIAAWGITQLVGPAHDPARDLPIPDLIAALSENPRYRTLITQNSAIVCAHADRMLSYLREGLLPLDAACALIDQFAEPGSQMRDAFMGDAWPDEGHGHFTRPPTGLPSLTPQDWDCWRRLRDAAEEQSEGWRAALFSLPLGPLCPSDRAFVDRAIAVMRAGDEGVRIGLAIALMSGGTAQDLTIMDEILQRELAGANERDGLIQRLRERMKTRLGIVPPKTRGPKKGHPSDTSQEWMDSDE